MYRWVALSACLVHEVKKAWLDVSAWLWSVNELVVVLGLMQYMWLECYR